jgi:menaquinone-9 beta-reductase
VDMTASAGGLAVFSRRAFDEMLVSRATAAGASWLPERVVDVTPDASGWKVTTRTGAIHARWLVGADGANSLVRKRVSQPFAREDLSIACGYYLHGASSARIDLGFETMPAGYFWSFPRRDHLAVGVCAQADAASVAMLMPLVDKWIELFRLKAEATGGAHDTRAQRYSWPIPSLRPQTIERQRAAGSNWMLLGDAAGLVDPITREGIFFALQSGEFAAASLAEADPVAAYGARLRDEIYPELLLASRIHARFYRPAFLALLISALQRSGRIRGVMADLVAGMQPYHSLRRRLLTTFELKLMWEMVCAPKGTQS